MPIPVIAGAILSALSWAGIELGIDYLSGDDSVELVNGMDFSTFLQYYWLPFLLYLVLIAVSLKIAVPKDKNNGRGLR